MTSYSETLVGFVAVPANEADDILANGYICSKVFDERVAPESVQNLPAAPAGTRRDGCHTARAMVPYLSDRTQAVSVLRKHRGDSLEFSTILEIHKVAMVNGVKKAKLVAEDLLADDRIGVYPPGVDSAHVAPHPDTNILEAKFITTGCVFQRAAVDHLNAPCPFCKAQIPDIGLQRGAVGMAQYIGNAFMVVPCPNAACKQAQMARQRRLDEEPAMELYHACARSVATLIKGCGGKFIRGAEGAGGGAIYMAHTRREVEWKAEDNAGTIFSQRPEAMQLADPMVVLKCKVKMGKSYQGGRDRPDTTFKNLVDGTLSGGPYDSVILDRGNTGHPVPPAPVKGTRVEDGGARHPGYEFLVYSWDQVEVLEEVDRDPVP